MAHHQHPVFTFNTVITIVAQASCRSDPDTGQEGTELGPHASLGPMTTELPVQLWCRVAGRMGHTS